MARILLLIFLLLPLISFGQNEQSIWQLGQNAGLDFSKTPASILYGSKLTSKGGGATMSDAFGNLLFYTDGVQVWNKNHQLMTNGIGLKGNPEVSQTVIIVPRPLHRYKYYIFTTDSRQTNAPNALRYSEVDMTLQGGLGEVVQKNKLVLLDVSEKITATFHDNNQDFWLLTHTWNTNTFYAYKIDSSGVSNFAITTDRGSKYTGPVTTGKGSFKVSNDFKGKHMLIALPDQNIFELTALDGKTGNLLALTSLNAISDRAAYAEFRSVSHFFTVSKKGDEIFEYHSNSNVTSLNSILLTSRLIGKSTGLGDLRLALDGLIYVTNEAKSTLHSIASIATGDYADYLKNPAIFKTDAISLAPNKMGEGLPNTVATFMNPLTSFVGASGACFGNPTVFRPNFPNSIDSVLWNFDDPRSGKKNFSNQLWPSHIFKTPGKIYKVKATIYARGMVYNLDEKMTVVDMRYAPDLGTDTSLCFNPGQRLELKPNIDRVKNIKWQDGSTGPTFTVTKPGIYWLEATARDYPCTFRDSIEIKSFPVPQVNLGNDTTICSGKTLLLKAGNAGSTFKWNDGSVKSTLLVTKPGNYKVTVTNTFGCTASDSIQVHYLTPPAINLGNDTTICSGTEFVLNGKLPGVSYKWQDGSTGSTFKVTRAGTYWVDATIDICTARDSIVIKTRKDCLGDLFAPNIITPNGDGVNDAFVLLDPDKSSIWQLEVFDRFGKSVYKSLTYNNKWDAAGLMAGVYYYLLQDDKNRKLKGYVEVVK